ncbi:MAG: methylenetetrahydrofolate reductase C-terminal domain-containing protein [Phycisphaeraceae bacterium]|nr:methylenetetrahydrofolate reductase C-terminal domain-containing protein [Phycisphaeraceae bacterium]
MLNGPCSWQLIYERLTNIGQTDKLKNINAPKDWSGCRGFVREDHRI